MSLHVWGDRDGIRFVYAWSFSCHEHGLVFVSAELSPTAEAMATVHASGCGAPVGSQPYQQRHWVG